MKYRRDIDGLRALAIAPVVLYHAGSRLFRGGFVGVDVFFVISGFLITSIILGELRTGKFTIAGFYDRRCRRILPALLSVIGACFVAGYLIMLPDQLRDMAGSAAASLLFVANGFFWVHTGYFAPLAGWMPLLNTWSLAVEEQYYVLFPLFMLMVRRWRTESQLFAIGAVLVLSFSLSVYGSHRHPSAAFYLTPFRAWELLLGVMIAYVPTSLRVPRVVREVGSALGLLMIALPVALYDHHTPFPGLAAAAPCAGTAALLVLGRTGGSFVRVLLEARPLVFIGLISYSWYLWHWPLFAFLRLRLALTELTPPLAAFATVASFMLAVLSWRFIERPFRRAGAFERRHVFQVSAASVLLILGVAAVFYSADGFPSRVSSEVLSFAEDRNDIDPMRDPCAGTIDDTGCRFGGDAQTEVSYAIWGDSDAAAIRPAIERAMRDTGKRGTILWLSSCPPLIDATVREHFSADACNRFRRDALRFLTSAHTDIDTVYLFGRWWPVGEELLPTLTRTIDALRASGKRVVLLGSMPRVEWNVPLVHALSIRHSLALPEQATRAEEERRQDSEEAIFEDLAQEEGVSFVRIWDLFCPDRCVVTADGRSLYSDSHLSWYGAREFLGPKLEPRLSRDTHPLRKHTHFKHLRTTPRKRVLP